MGLISAHEIVTDLYDIEILMRSKTGDEFTCVVMLAEDWDTIVHTYGRAFEAKYRGARSEYKGRPVYLANTPKGLAEEFWRLHRHRERPIVPGRHIHLIERDSHAKRIAATSQRYKGQS